MKVVGHFFPIQSKRCPTTGTIFSPDRLAPQNPSQTHRAGGRAGNPPLRGRAVHINELGQVLLVDMPIMPLDVSWAFYCLPLNPVSAMQLAALTKNWSAIFWKLQWYWSQPFSPPSFSMALTANYLITGIFGHLLTDSFLFCDTASCTLTRLATACCFL